MKQLQSNQKNSNAQVGAIKNTMDKTYRLSISVLMLLMLSLLLLSCSDKKKDATKIAIKKTNQVSQTANEDLVSSENYEIVPNEKVCMVNDRFMGVQQIPIDVNGTTYYGCCEGCVEKLQKNIDDVRFGSNPFNDKKVDKASAVIVQDKSNGSVFYFASKEDTNQFINPQ